MKTPTNRASVSRSAGSSIKGSHRFAGPWMNQRAWGSRPKTMYQLTDRLHDGHVAQVAGNEIAVTLSSWLADLGASSPLVNELARAVQQRDWPSAYAIG